MIIKTAEYNAKLIFIFIKWYWIEMPVNILKKIYQYVISISKVFSFSFLLKTFFSPWKNQLYSYPSKGFDIKIIFEILTSNLISRFVGAFIRGITLFFGITLLILTLLIGLIYVFIWIFYPIIFLILILISF